MTTALITGIRGQDGAYLARLLLEKGYKVYGADRRSGGSVPWRLRKLDIEHHIEMVYMDLLEYSNVLRVLEEVQPHEVYNLAAQSFVGASFEQPIVTSHVNAMGALHLLEAIRTVDPSIRFYQASTSEMFGRVRSTPQNEDTPFYPRSPYGVSKLFAHAMTVNYREAHGLFACSGILFNHESPLRGEEFVTRKITRGVAHILTGKQETLKLGNLNASRDWGYAPEYVEGMWRMLSAPEPRDYVLATGKTHTVRQFVNTAFEQNIRFKRGLTWVGEGANERGYDEHGVLRVTIDPKLYRAAEVDMLCGDASRAREGLGWEPKTSLEKLVAEMLREDHRDASDA